MLSPLFALILTSAAFPHESPEPWIAKPFGYTAATTSKQVKNLRPTTDQKLYFTMGNVLINNNIASYCGAYMSTQRITGNVFLFGPDDRLIAAYSIGDFQLAKSLHKFNFFGGRFNKSFDYSWNTISGLVQITYNHDAFEEIALCADDI